ncbi:centrosomal protein 15 [Discoglossus pictus]
MTSYLSKEVELSRRHEDIIAKRVELLEEMKIHLAQQDHEKKNHSQEAEAAHERNQSILEDLQDTEQRLNTMVQSSPHPDFVGLHNQYWESVEQEIPKWEQFLLGKAQSPFGMKKKQLSKQKLYNSQTMQSLRKQNLPPSGYYSNTFPR